MFALEVAASFDPVAILSGTVAACVNDRVLLEMPRMKYRSAAWRAQVVRPGDAISGNGRSGTEESTFSLTDSRNRNLGKVSVALPRWLADLKRSLSPSSERRPS